MFYALVGIPLTGLTLRSIGNRVSEGLSTLIKSCDRRFYNRETEKLEIKTAVLAFIILLLIIFLPAVGFHLIEQWEYIESVYFCFITLTTIGFGDFVPGKVKKTVADDGVVATLEFLNLIYMVVGLAVMSGVIVSISGVIEEKTKNFGVDPMEALRNIRVENLNSRALKKLGYKMGNGAPGGDDSMGQRMPPKMASRTMGPPMNSTHDIHKVTTGNMNSMADRSRSAETMDFQGPTPVLHLNKKINGTASSGNNSPMGTPPEKRMFNNKVAPANGFNSEENFAVETSTKSDSLRRSSEHLSNGTETAEEAQASDEDNMILEKMEQDSGENQADATRKIVVKSLQPNSKRDSKNELVVEVQLTPMPSPIPSPSPLQAAAVSPPPFNRSEPDIGEIETYEESIKGSIDSSNTFTREDGQKAMLQRSISRDSNSKDLGLSMDEPPKDRDLSLDELGGHVVASAASIEKHSETSNGFISKGSSFGPRRGKLKSEEHIDLGDRTVSRRITR
ncbi:uncharacterized protein LOC5513661 isoform X2 [Nematostella vectensis]|nr:uncharacterized protein LOC5513661 isoform X2 [Nematostella vectensis]